MSRRARSAQRAPVQLYLVRHGATAWNEGGRFQGQSDVPLNDRGIEQAEAAARRLRGLQAAAIYSSDLRRARQTAEIIAAALRRPQHAVRLCRSLREIDFGSWEGLTWIDIERRWGTLLDQWCRDPRSATPPGGEPFVHFEARVRHAISTIASRHPGQTVIVVTHGGVIAFLASWRQGVMFRPLEHFRLPPGGFVNWSIDGTGWSTSARSQKDQEHAGQDQQRLHRRKVIGDADQADDADND